MHKKVIRALDRFGLLDNIIVGSSVTLNGRKFNIPIVSRIGLDNLSMSELWMIDLLKILVKLNLRAGSACFVDVGVNVGQTLLKVKSVSAEMDYIGFEPNPLCIFYINNLIKSNKFGDCRIIPVGLSDSTDLGTLHFFNNSLVDSSATLIPDFRPVNKIDRTEYVPVFGLEQIKDKVGLLDFSILKIDVEGAELEVLKSFRCSIEKAKPIILIEILPVYDMENTSRLERQRGL